MSWNLLERFIESEHFNRDPSLTVAYLARYAEHVGIQYVLCSKLRQFSYEEIEFFLPQLCHLLISLDNESMALEEFILDLCEESVNGALLTFWLFQTYLHDLSAEPSTNTFQTCRRLYNRVQSIVFGGSEPVARGRIHDNVLPVTVLASLILSSVAVPLLPRHAGPLAIAQARRPRPIEDVISGEASIEPQLARSNTVGATPGGTNKTRPAQAHRRKSSRLKLDGHADIAHSEPGSPRRHTRLPSAHHRQVLGESDGAFASASSLPDQARKLSLTGTNSLDIQRRPNDIYRRHSHNTKHVLSANLPRSHKIRILRQNYFRSEMQLLAALENISTRLVSVPKPARLSALRAELALIAADLPAEVDIPLICPATLVDGVASRSRHHRIVRLNPGEATSLNSAEKVPYLLMLEVLREDFDFNPDSEHNQELLAKLLSDSGKRRRLFDSSDASRKTNDIRQSEEQIDSVFEPTKGDLSSPALLKDPDEDPYSSANMRARVFRESSRTSVGAGSTTPSTSLPNLGDVDDTSTTSGSPANRGSPFLKAQNVDQADVSALAIHMRTAAQMLAQLETSTQKRPKAEVAAIKAKIIASMQSLEEQSFLADESIAAPTFEAIMAKASAIQSETKELTTNIEEELVDELEASGRGAARMENDLATGGVARKGDRDDPSAATFGEAWEQKKERIRRTSPYGWIKNWDLVSVIVKTGADLRQEAFACQLIAVCSKIWSEHNVNVWVKNMRILVTGESSGLIETITNAVSLHSLKRSLTLASIAAGTNPKKRIATLQDHYTKTFGAPDSTAYSKAISNFSKSFAAYSVISYVLQLKDRHNGNILIDSEGHMIHIDFGFMLSNSPGNMGFEAAPFKFTMEYLEVLGGVESATFANFKELMKDAFQALRREAERIVMLVELMGRQSKMDAYGIGFAAVVAALRSRFVLEKSKEEARDVVEDLITKSIGSYYTRLYDTFQYRTQGIY